MDKKKVLVVEHEKGKSPLTLAEAVKRFSYKQDSGIEVIPALLHDLNYDMINESSLVLTPNSQTKDRVIHEYPVGEGMRDEALKYFTNPEKLSEELWRILPEELFKELYPKIKKNILNDKRFEVAHKILFNDIIIGKVKNLYVPNVIFLRMNEDIPGIQDKYRKRVTETDIEHLDTKRAAEFLKRLYDSEIERNSKSHEELDPEDLQYTVIDKEKENTYAIRLKEGIIYPLGLLDKSLEYRLPELIKEFI